MTFCMSQAQFFPPAGGLDTTLMIPQAGQLYVGSKMIDSTVFKKCRFLSGMARLREYVIHILKERCIICTNLCLFGGSQMLD